MTAQPTLAWNVDRAAWHVGETATHFVDIIPMIFNHRLVLTPKACPQTYDAGWCYPSLDAALVAFALWDIELEPEPSGYIKRAV